VSLVAKAEALAKVVVDTDDEFGRVYEAVTLALALAPSVGELDAAAAVIFAHAPRTTDVEREINLFLVTGAMVEAGRDPTIGWPHLRARLGAVVARLAAAADHLDAQQVDLDAGGAPPALERALRVQIGAFRYLVMAAMARLARRADLRAEVRADEAYGRDVATLQRACASSHGYFLAEIQRMFDGPLLVVDVTTQAVERWDVEAVRNGAHLIALLDGVDARALATTEGATHRVQHHYTSFGALDEVVEGLFRSRRLRSVDWMFMLGVERPVGRIPSLDLPLLGQLGIVIKAPPVLARRFDPADAFAPFHDACIERATCVRTLAGAERAAVVAAIVPAARRLRADLGRATGATTFPPELMHHPRWLAHWNDPA